jgi:hypothetical protein
MRKYFILFCQFCSHLLFLIFIKNIKFRYKNLLQIFLTDQSLIEKYIKCCMENKFFSFTNYLFLAATGATYSHSKNICMPKLSFSTSLLKTFPCCSLAKLFFINSSVYREPSAKAYAYLLVHVGKNIRT